MTELSATKLTTLSVTLILSLSLTALLSPLSTSAADPEPANPPPPSAQDILEFLKEESVSIAVRHEQPISQAPSNVYVITDEDIRQSGAPDLPTVLRRIPGMEVMQVTGADFNVSMRGDNQLVANKLLVMVDGRSIYIDVQGQVIWKAIPVTLPEIKRIEVLKGPASVLYGFNAFDGIINIITKSPEEMKGRPCSSGAGLMAPSAAPPFMPARSAGWAIASPTGTIRTSSGATAARWHFVPTSSTCRPSMRSPASPSFRSQGVSWM